MNFIDIIIIAFLVIWCVLAMRHIIKTKKAGGCVGCREADQCMRNQKMDCKKKQ